MAVEQQDLPLPSRHFLIPNASTRSRRGPSTNTVPATKDGAHRWMRAIFGLRNLQLSSRRSRPHRP
jgi:hypothetical protein